MTVSAQQLASAYKDNEVAGDERYKGKIIAVTGVVDSIGKDILDTPYVVLSSGERFSITGVQCMFGDEHKSQLAALSKGQTVTIVGECEGKMMNVLLKNCRFR